MSWYTEWAEQKAENELEQATNQVRTKRDKLIAATDHMLLPDYPNKPDGLAEYRQALRDVPQQEGFPDVVDWPDFKIDANA